MDTLIRLLAGPWTLYILWVLQENGELRFLSLKEKVAGISAKVLTERLRMLAGEGLIERTTEASTPPQVSYRLSERGRQLRGVLQPLNELAGRWYGGGETLLES
ncbi:MAG: winged helix-turn-helix transcriptional regulator [Bryobacteraceae bacterium]|nr:winged helix-turn-helix transcriptional regulator [Bryobacteraceae bacterium]